MDPKITIVQKNIEADALRLLLPIQTKWVLDPEAFASLHANAKELARLLKGQDLVPKDILHSLNSTVKVLRAEAPYMGTQAERLVKMADDLAYTFDLILADESHEDRSPGVPRII